MQLTALQMMTMAERTAKGQELHRIACNAIPGGAVVVTADIDGSGRVTDVSVPGIKYGQGGTADVLEAALRHVRALEQANASMRRVAKRLGLPEQCRGLARVEPGMTDESTPQSRLAIFAAMVRDRLAAIQAEYPDGEATLAIVVRKPDGSGRVACGFDLAFLADVEAVAGPDPRSDEERAADRIIAQFGGGW